jgi:hypothetical protein
MTTDTTGNTGRVIAREIAWIDDDGTIAYTGREVRLPEPTRETLEP